MLREPGKVSPRPRQTRRFHRRMQKMQTRKQNSWTNILPKKENANSFWQMWFLNRLRRIPPTRMIRGVDFLVLNHPGRNNPLGEGTPNGPRGILGKNNKYVRCVIGVHFTPPSPELRRYHLVRDFIKMSKFWAKSVFLT